MANNNNKPYPGSEFSGNGRYNGQYNGSLYRGSDNGPMDEDEIDLRKLFALLWRRKWLIVSVTVLCTVLAGTAAWYQTPIYQSDGSMIIKSSKGSPLGGSNDGLGSMMSSTFGIGMGSNVQNEMQVLQSRNLSNDVAQKMLEEPIMANGRMYPVLWRAWPEDSVKVPADSAAARIRDKMTISRVDREADVVQLTYQSPSPLATKNVINLYLETYSDFSTEQKRRAAQSAVSFLSKERKRIKEELDQSTEQLRAFMDTNKLVSVDEQAQSLIQTISELESTKQEVRGKLVAAEAGLDRYNEQLNQIRPGLADQYAEALAPKMARYQYQLAELETEKMLYLQKNPQLRDRQDTEPVLKELNSKIEVLREQINTQAKQLLQQSDQYLGFLGSPDGNLSEDLGTLHQKLIELKVQKSQYESQLEVLNERLAEQQRFFDRLPNDMIQLARLKRDVAINEELYKTVSQQNAEMQLWRETQFGLGQPLDYAYVPVKPVEPNKPLWVLVGMILGGILSVGYVFVNESFNTTIEGTETLREKGYPLLAVIPNMREMISKKFGGQPFTDVQGRRISTGLMTVLDSISPTSEAYRRLLNNVLYSQPDEPHRTILVTSSKQGEGKSTVSANLAVVMAEAGRSVVLVDMDYRRPQVHNQFGVSQTPGLIEAVFGEIELDQAIRPAIVDGVELLTAGRRPPNPAAINQSKKLSELLDTLKERYDHVILDNPPYGIITDAAPVLHRADGVLVVTQFGMTEEPELDHTLSNLERVKAPVIGTILNAFEHEKSRDYYYHGGYYQYAYRQYYSYHDD